MPTTMTPLSVVDITGDGGLTVATDISVLSTIAPNPAGFATAKRGR